MEDKKIIMRLFFKNFHEDESQFAPEIFKFYSLERNKC